MDGGNPMLLMKVLDCLSARAVVTAQNIANAGTPNYRPLRVTFEQALHDAAAAGGDAVRQLTAHIENVSATEPQELRLDLELATASATAMRYSALVDVLSRQMQIEMLAIKGSN